MADSLNGIDWNQIRAFVSTAELGSLSAAALKLGLTQPTLSRQVAALEARLGVSLFEKIGRSLQLTPNGKDLLSSAQVMLEASQEFALSAAGKSSELSGPIAISATEVMAVYYLPPVLKKLSAMMPNVQIELVASNKPSDIKRREADIAIRAFRPTDPDLIVKKIAEQHYSFYGTQEYIASLGKVSSLADLTRANFIGFDRSSEFIDVLSEYGLSLTQSNFSIVCQHQMSQWQLVKAGVGLGVMEQQVGDADPCVRRVLEHIDLPMSELWLVTHRELRTNARIRRVFDFLIEHLSANKNN